MSNSINAAQDQTDHVWQEVRRRALCSLQVDRTPSGLGTHSVDHELLGDSTGKGEGLGELDIKAQKTGGPAFHN